MKLKLDTHKNRFQYPDYPPYAVLRETANYYEYELWLFDEDPEEPSWPHMLAKGGMVQFKNWEYA